jgi:hypothetical protein
MPRWRGSLADEINQNFTTFPDTCRWYDLRVLRGSGEFVEYGHVSAK